MKKQALTKRDIQAELARKINKPKAAMVWLTILLCVFVAFYIAYVVCYANGIYLQSDKFSSITPAAAIIICPFLMLPLATAIFIYYSNLYKIKAGKFEIAQEKLCGKAEEWRRYYHHSQREKILYFKRGKVAVESDVYSYSNIGDTFWLVVLNNGRPLMAYSKKYYEIKEV